MDKKCLDGDSPMLELELYFWVMKNLDVQIKEIGMPVRLNRDLLVSLAWALDLSRKQQPE